MLKHILIHDILECLMLLAVSVYDYPQLYTCGSGVEDSLVSHVKHIYISIALSFLTFFSSGICT